MHLFGGTRRPLLTVAFTAALATIVLGLLGCTPTSGGAAAAKDSDRFSFALWGDLPYAKANNADDLPRMIADMNAQKLAFTIFDGDIKDGSSRCDNSVYGEAVTRFNSVAVPTVYAVGDNEWTDCHRSNNGDYNALERLEYIRKNMFGNEASFGKSTMALEHQGAPGAKYAENTRWFRGNVAFIGLNMIGSNNGFVADAKGCADGGRTKRTAADCDADNAEAAERDAKNIDWMRQTFAQASQKKLAGVMIVAQADLSFDIAETTTVDERSDPAYNGFNKFFAAMVEETQKFPGQVVYVHGDTHFFKVDKPLAIDPAAKGNLFVANDNAKAIGNFTRVETFGSANVSWVKATVDPTSRNVFSFEPMILGQTASR